MRGLVLVIAFALSACVPVPPHPLVGSWRLERYVDTPEGGEPIETFGADPRGLFVFSADGYASISMMRNPPTPGTAPTDPDPDACVPDWYCSYFGPYTIADSAWTVHVEGANVPSFVGTDQTRNFSIVGDRLILTGSYQDLEGRTVTLERELIRVSSGAAR